MRNCRFSLCATMLIAIALISGCAHHAANTTPNRLATQVDDKRASEPSSNVDYGEEEFRQVSTNDEIISTLRNGLVVIVKRVPSPVCAVRAYALTGGVYEGKWLGGGLSHLLEHMVAGCSNERRTEEQNRNLLQAIGNNSNAYTDYDHTAFYVNTTTQHLDEALDLVSGWMFTCKIVPAEYHREYEIVQRELEKDKGQPDDVFAELTFSNRYRVNPARVPVIGYQEVIQGLSRDDVYSYYQLAYQPNNMVFAIAGDLPTEQMLKAVQKQVKTYKPGRAFSHDVAPEPELTGPRTVVATFPKLGAAKLELAFPSVKLDSPDVYALDLLATVLGGGESAILTEELRDKKELAEAISASDFTPTYAEGSFAIEMSIDPENLQAATAATLDVIEAVKSSGVAAERLARAKTQMRVAHIKARQTTEEIISTMATDYIASGDAHYSDRYLERIDKLASADLQNVAKKYLVRNKLLTTALVSTDGPRAEGLPAAEDLLRAAAPTTKPTAEPVEPSTISRTDLGSAGVLVHRRMTTSPLVSIQVYALGGLTAEDEKTNGIGNLTMDMLLRGTQSRSAEQIAESLDAMGADLDAGCGSNTWAWSASCLKDDLPKLTEIFADVIANPAFAGDELGKVRDRTLAAIDAQDADWSAQGMRFFKAQFFGPSKSPYRFQTIGSADNVKGFTADQVKKWYAQKVLKGPRVIAIFGDVSLDTAKATAQKLLGSLPAISKPEATVPMHIHSLVARSEKPSVNVGRFEVQKTDQPLAGVFIGFQSDSTFASPDRFATTVADCMTSGYEGPTGYLFDDLRGRGLVYQVDADDMPGLSPKMPGAFVALAGCDPAKVNEVVDVMLLNIARLQGTPKDVQADWFDRSKQLITTQDALDQETPEAQAAEAALDELYGLGYDAHAQFAAKINAVTLDQVRELAKTKLHDCIITISTPKPELVNRATRTRLYDSFPPVDLTPRGVQHDTAGGTAARSESASEAPSAAGAAPSK